MSLIHFNCFLVQHDIIMYWSQRFRRDPLINIVLKGSNSQTANIRLQQNTERLRTRRLPGKAKYVDPVE